jgi:hypothetical protein
MFRYVPRSGYRVGEKRVDVWLSLAGRARLGVLADVWGCSLSDVVARLVRESTVGVGSSSVDWGVVLAAGAKPVREVPVVCVVDPLEEIA